MGSGKLDLSEIQGLLASGYGRQRALCCLLLKISDPQSARHWLRDVMSQITFCGDKQSESKLNLAFTFPALQFLVGADELYGFSQEFCEGIVTPHRQRILGDLPGGRSDPQHWKWGGPQSEPIHLLLLVYELNTAALDRRMDAIRTGLQGLNVVAELRSTALKDAKEHFGFKDDIGQPWVAELHRAEFERDRIALGELVLGYDDDSGASEPAPTIARNGSYLVLRQMVQRVPEFWNALPNVSDDEKIRQASKMVGRWPDGTPLTLSPDRPDQTKPLNDFVFAKLDADGTRCPLGSHIRRANPRDTLLPDATQSLKEVNRHRILRRGRTFGPPASASAYPSGIVVTAEEDTRGAEDERGILFMCLNASLSRQFEFCQHSWLNNPKFATLSTDTDAIGSSVQWSGPGQEPTVTSQACPVRVRRVEQDKYVHTVGGGYFFLPSRAMLVRLWSAAI